jgi:lectin-like protein/thrombospondin type 3 repeat protein
MPPSGHITLPGDLVVLVRDNAGPLRISVSAWTTSLVGRGTALAQPVAKKETAVDMLILAPPGADGDGDGVPNSIDNCANVANADQADRDGNGIGDACQAAPPDGGGAGVCGDGNVDPGEDCDDGGGNSDAPASAATCTTHCKRRSPCGDLTSASAAAIDPDTGHCYIAWGAVAQPWQVAQADCQSRGGMLAVITSDGEETLVERLTGTVVYWIGLWRAAPGDNMTWIDGEAVGYMKFAPGQPEAGNQTCGDIASDGWHDATCGFALTGNLVGIAGSTPRAYVCENSCGNGLVDPGETCDPPGADCTVACQRKAICTETNGQLAALTGNCFFPAGTPAAYDPAGGQCPAGTHLAAPQSPDETQAAFDASVGNAAALWIGLRAPTTLGVFAWDVAGFSFVPDRYHGFVGNDPNEAATPQCVAVDPASPLGWHDRACTNTYASLCEREH